LILDDKMLDNATFGLPAQYWNVTQPCFGAQSSGIDPCRAMSLIEVLGSLNLLVGILLTSIVLWIFQNWAVMLTVARVLSVLAVTIGFGHAIVSFITPFGLFLQLEAYCGLPVTIGGYGVAICWSFMERWKRQQSKASSGEAALKKALNLGKYPYSDDLFSGVVLSDFKEFVIDDEMVSNDMDE